MRASSGARGRWRCRSEFGRALPSRGCYRQSHGVAAADRAGELHGRGCRTPTGEGGAAVARRTCGGAVHVAAASTARVRVS